MNTESLVLKHKLRIDWSELDYFKHVNNVSYFKYVQSARVNVWDYVGLSDHFARTGQGAMLASTRCDFKRPLHYPGHVDIVTGVESIGTSSFSFAHSLYNDAGELAAVALDVMVMYDFNEHRKLPVPEWLRTSLGF